jgi:hypothetical protein
MVDTTSEVDVVLSSILAWRLRGSVRSARRSDIHDGHQGRPRPRHLSLQTERIAKDAAVPICVIVSTGRYV